MRGLDIEKSRVSISLSIISLRRPAFWWGRRKTRRREREREGNKIVRVITLQCEMETCQILIGQTQS